MRKLTTSDLMSLEQYEPQRPILRRQIIELKQIRRIALGPNISIVFENWDTARWQTLEMLRTERITDPKMVEEEVETYNELIPDANELRATLFIELPDTNNIPRDLPKFIGVEETVAFQFNGQTVPGEAEPGRSTEDKTATVHYLQFHFTPAQVDAFNGQVKLTANHKNYTAETELGPATVDSLKQDLTS